MKNGKTCIQMLNVKLQKEEDEKMTRGKVLLIYINSVSSSARARALFGTPLTMKSPASAVHLVAVRTALSAVSFPDGIPVIIFRYGPPPYPTILSPACQSQSPTPSTLIQLNFNQTKPKIEFCRKTGYPSFNFIWNFV